MWFYVQCTYTAQFDATSASTARLRLQVDVQVSHPVPLCVGCCGGSGKSSSFPNSDAHLSLSGSKTAQSVLGDDIGIWMSRRGVAVNPDFFNKVGVISTFEKCMLLTFCVAVKEGKQFLPWPVYKEYLDRG